MLPKATTTFGVKQELGGYIGHIMANFKNGVIRDGSSIGNGNILGNLKNGVIRKGIS